jgi:methyltransferase (TIGR00027 family)
VTVASAFWIAAVRGTGRPYRLDLPPDLDWYEIDRREVFAAKEKTLSGHRSTCRRHVVVTDVGADWPTRLAGAGFDRTRRTLWLAEGLFFYLTGETSTGLLRGAADLSSTGSLFAADVMPRTGLDLPALRPYREYCARNGMPPPFGCDDPVGLFTGGGWRPRHITAPGAPDANYGRLPPQRNGFVPGRTHLVVGAVDQR